MTGAKLARSSRHRGLWIDVRRSDLIAPMTAILLRSLSQIYFQIVGAQLEVPFTEIFELCVIPFTLPVIVWLILLDTAGGGFRKSRRIGDVCVGALFLIVGTVMI